MLINDSTRSVILDCGAGEASVSERERRNTGGSEGASSVEQTQLEKGSERMPQRDFLPTAMGRASARRPPASRIRPSASASISPIRSLALGPLPPLGFRPQRRRLARADRTGERCRGETDE